jgi:hypothetical protein
MLPNFGSGLVDPNRVHEFFDMVVRRGHLATLSTWRARISAASVTDENIIGYDHDRLFRSERPPRGDISYTRSEAARILLTASSHRGVDERPGTVVRGRVAPPPRGT